MGKTGSSHFLFGEGGAVCCPVFALLGCVDVFLRMLMQGFLFVLSLSLYGFYFTSTFFPPTM